MSEHSKNRVYSENLKNRLLIIIGIILFVITLQGIILFNMSNTIFSFWLSLISQSAIPTMFMFPFVILIMLPIISKKSDKVLLTSKHTPIMVLTLLIIFALNLNYLAIKQCEHYTINGKKVSGIEAAIRILGDTINNETIEIKTNDIKTTGYIWKYLSGGKHSTRLGSPIEQYYLNINDYDYLIPIFNRSDKVDNLLYQNSYYESGINTITVYKNSKIIKQINGIDL